MESKMNTRLLYLLSSLFLFSLFASLPHKKKSATAKTTTATDKPTKTSPELALPEKMDQRPSDGGEYKI